MVCTKKMGVEKSIFLRREIFKKKKHVRKWETCGFTLSN